MRSIFHFFCFIYFLLLSFLTIYKMLIFLYKNISILTKGFLFYSFLFSIFQSFIFKLVSILLTNDKDPAKVSNNSSQCSLLENNVLPSLPMYIQALPCF